MSRRRSKWDVAASDVATENNGSTKSATEAARERAAKLTAMLAAKGKLANNVGAPLPVMSQTTAFQPSTKTDKEQDLLYAEIEINDSPARIILCKGTTQDEINRYSGAAVSTKGRYMDAEEKNSVEKDGERPLYLCIQASTQDKIEFALKRIKEIMKGTDIHGVPLEQTSTRTRWSPYEPPVSTVNNSYSSPNTTPITQQQNQMLPTGMHYVQDKVFVGLEHVSPEFDVKDKLLGPGGSYFQHICTETGAKVFLKGKGSGFLEPTSGREAFEALHIYINHTKQDGLSAAKKLVENLLQTVKSEYHNFEQRKRGMQAGYPPHPGYPQPGYVHPSFGYPPGVHPPPGVYPVPPVGPSPPYGHLPPVPPQPLPPPPPPPHGQLMLPPGFGAPPQQGPAYQEPPMHGGQQNGVRLPHPGYQTPVHQGAPPPNVPYPPRPDMPQGNFNAPHLPAPPPNVPPPLPPREEEPEDAYKRDPVPPPLISQPEPPPKRRFKEVPRSEPQQPPKPKSSTKESSREASYLGTKKDQMFSRPSPQPQGPKKEGVHVMPPPPSPGGLLPPPKLQPKTSPDQTDFKKPLGMTKVFTPPLPPKILLGKQQSAQKPNLSVGSKKHGLSSLPDKIEPKKAKREEPEVVSSGLGSLVAYEGDSSEEEEEEVQQSIKISKLNESKLSTRTKKQHLPFWAVGK